MTWQDVIKKAGFVLSDYRSIKPVRIIKVSVDQVNCVNIGDKITVATDTICYKVIRIDKKNSILHLQEL